MNAFLTSCTRYETKNNRATSAGRKEQPADRGSTQGSIPLPSLAGEAGVCSRSEGRVWTGGGRRGAKDSAKGERERQHRNAPSGFQPEKSKTGHLARPCLWTDETATRQPTQASTRVQPIVPLPGRGAVGVARGNPKADRGRHLLTLPA